MSGSTEPRSWSSVFLTLYSISGISSGLIVYIALQDFYRGLLSGVIGGFIFSFIYAFLFKGKKVVISLENSEKEEFIKDVSMVLSQVHYRLKTRLEDFLTYKPPFYAFFMAGKIYITINQNEATIIGAIAYIIKIEKTLLKIGYYSQ
jgi:hypothetical protein